MASSSPRPEVRALLDRYGITDRDWRRIKAHALSITETNMPAALADLDCPYRVGACLPGWETRFSGEVIGKFRGRPILVWPKR